MGKCVCVHISCDTSLIFGQYKGENYMEYKVKRRKKRNSIDMS